MFKKFSPACLWYALILLVISGTHGYSSEDAVSGSVQDGYRILSIQPNVLEQSFMVYRGDYIKFALPEKFESPIVEFPTLGQKKSLSQDIKTTPYFKMKKKEVVPFQINNIQGRIRVIEYQWEGYQTLTANQANNFIKDQNPVILDVRTPKEYSNGHLENSILIPVQYLEKRISELHKYKNRAILVYCHTGNRSSVASKILIDGEFSNVVNLKYGIIDWYKKKYKVVH